MTSYENTAVEIARVQHKTGEYLVEVMEKTGNKALVKTLAVLTHPTQGDLHHPAEVDVVLFHQRRALAHQEKVWVPAGSLQAYHGAVPDYQESLRKALEKQIQGLEKTIRFAERSLVELAQLQKDYFPSK